VFTDPPSRLRRVAGSLQLPVAGVGLVVCLAAGASFASLLGNAPAEGDGFVHGAALLFAYLFAAVGYAGFATGLAIPPGPGVGVRFGRWQRRLFAVGAVGAVASLLLPLLGLPLAYRGDANLVVVLWAVPTLVALVAVPAGLVWRAVDEIRDRR